MHPFGVNWQIPFLSEKKAEADFSSFVRQEIQKGDKPDLEGRSFSPFHTWEMGEESMPSKTVDVDVKHKPGTGAGLDPRQPLEGQGEEGPFV